MEMKELSLLLAHGVQRRYADDQKGLYPIARYTPPGFHYLAVSPLGDKSWACDRPQSLLFVGGYHTTLFVQFFYESVAAPLASEFRKSAIDDHYGKWMIYNRNPSTQSLDYLGRAEQFLRLPAELPLRSFGVFS